MAGPREAPRAAKLQDITRRFGPVTALERVRFDLLPGEIHGLLGENGAGKTTLARVLGGLLAPDAGRVEIGGHAVTLSSARDARAMGVAMVHQHFSLVPRFTGFENVALFNGEAWTGRGTAARGYRARVEARAAELKLDVELDAPVAGLGVGERQRIEILKALMSETRVLLLDEPTAVLTPGEVDGLLDVLGQVARAGTGIVLVAHKLDEVLAAADRVTVLRRGRWVLTEKAEALSARELAEAMVGGALPGGGAAGGRSGDRVRQAGAGGVGGAGGPGGVGDQGSSVAVLEGVAVGSAGASSLRAIDLTVRRGEIVGVAGVDGNGQRELAGVLAGVIKPAEGAATLPDEVGWIPQDRGAEGLVDDFTITENVAFALHGAGSHRKGPWLDWAGIGKTAAGLVREMDVRAGSPDDTAGTLSGGNQQKVVTGREFLRARDLLVAESPTRGLDVKATRAVRARIAALASSPWINPHEHRERRGAGLARRFEGGIAALFVQKATQSATIQRGCIAARMPRGFCPRAARTADRPPGIVLISADLDEILELADRIVVIVRGRLIPVPPESRTVAAIGELMLSAGTGDAGDGS